MFHFIFDHNKQLSNEAYTSTNYIELYIVVIVEIGTLHLNMNEIPWFLPVYPIILFLDRFPWITTIYGVMTCRVMTVLGSYAIYDAQTFGSVCSRNLIG